MDFSKLQKPIQRALIVTSKFGFLRKETFWNHLTPPTRSYKFKLWSQLIASGYFAKYNRPGVAHNYYCLSKKGIRFMKGNGFAVVCKAHPIHFEHDEVIHNFALACENKQLIKSDWVTEYSFRNFSAMQQIDILGGSQLEKIPDLLFKMNTDPLKLTCALEIERSQKIKSRYDSLILAYARNRNVGLVLIATSNSYIVDSIKESIKRLGYPQASRPIAFCKIINMVDKPDDFDIEIDGKFLNFQTYVENLKIFALKSKNKLVDFQSTKKSSKLEVAA